MRFIHYIGKMRFDDMDKIYEEWNDNLKQKDDEIKQANKNYQQLEADIKLIEKNLDAKADENKRLRGILAHIKGVSMGHTYVDTRRDINSQIVDQILKYIDANFQ